MSDPADKSDDLIAELARLMATPTAPGKPAVQPVPARPAATAPAAAPTPAPSGPVPIRIPGMDSMARSVPAQPAPVAEATPVVTPQPEPRPAATGAIRIPGMDQPPPVTASAPVGKFEFPGAQPVKAEPILSLADRIARSEESQNRMPQPPQPPQPAVVRVNPPAADSARAPEPQIPQARSTAAPAAPSVSPPSDFHFDFGFSNSPPQPTAAPQQRTAAAAVDPIAALIEADLAAPAGAAPVADAPANAEPAVRTPTVARFTQAAPAPAPARPAVAPAPANVQRAAATPVPLKPVSTAPRSNPAADRFMFAPGTGLDMKAEPVMPPREGMTASTAPSVDPMDQLESLIGEAVRVELTPEPARVQTPQVVSPKVQLEPEPELAAEIRSKGEAPVVPPLNSAFAPRRTRIKDEQRAADEAILAAVAASNPDMAPVAEPAPQDGPYRRLKVKPQKTGFLSGGMRQVIGMAVAGTLLLAAGLGLYWVLNMGRSANVSGDNAPQLTADTTPVKVKPAETQKPETDAAKSPVLAKIDGASAPAGGEQLVSTEDTNAGAVTRDVTPTDANSEGGLANRKVRTVTVRPDGTIVPGDDAVAGTQELPVDRPNVPDVPATATTTLLNGDASAAPTVAATTLPSVGDGSTDPVATASASYQIGEAPVIDPMAVAPQPMNFPVRTAATAPLAAPEAPLGSTLPANSKVNAVVGAQTPNGQIDLLNGGATAAQPAPASTGGTAAAYVQLSSQPTQADGQAAARVATSKFGNLFGGQQLVVQQADLGQKGIRWRVRLPVSSLTEAQSVCAQIKAQGGDCFATGG